MKLTLKVGEDQDLRQQIMTLIKQSLDGLARKDARDILIEEAKRVFSTIKIEEILKRAVMNAVPPSYLTVPVNRHGLGVTNMAWKDWIMEHARDYIREQTKEGLDAAMRAHLQRLVAEQVDSAVQRLVIRDVVGGIDALAEKSVRDALRRILEQKT